MALVMDVCSYIYVLDFGNPLFAGEPDAVLASAEVRAAYLGDEHGSDSGEGDALTAGSTT